MNNFHEHFSTFDNEKLFKIILDPNDYQPQAIAAAQAIVKERGVQEELAVLLKERDAAQEVQEQQAFDEIVEKAKYYKSVVEIKQQGFYFNIRVSDVPKFESQLAQHAIEFHREDKHIGAQLDTYPTQIYYFKREDTEIVDQLVKGLKLVTVPYMDIKPFFKLEFFVLLAVIILFILLSMAYGDELFPG